MFYLSSALILLGILIFVYSIIADAQRRREDISSGEGVRDGAAAGTAGIAERQGRTGTPIKSKNNTAAVENQAAGLWAGAGSVDPGVGGAPTAENSAVDEPDGREMTAVLFEDNSRIIDYSSETVSIDPGRAGYKKIRRIGSGRLSLEKAGISFHLGKKLYRYDFHRVRDIKTGRAHMALFLAGSDSVKLFIFNAGSSAANMVADAYGDYQRGGE